MASRTRPAPAPAKARPPRRPGSGHRREPDPLAARIGARIRQLRAEKSFTFDAFVEETGLGRGYVSELERGLVVPTVGALERVAVALEVTLTDLVSGQSERERLFEDLRDASATLVKQLRERVRTAKRR